MRHRRHAETELWPDTPGVDPDYRLPDVRVAGEVQQPLSRATLSTFEIPQDDIEPAVAEDRIDIGIVFSAVPGNAP